YPASLVRLIGLIGLGCLGLYLASSTSVLGAIVLTGYLGGAIATHIRIGSPLFTHILFPVYVALLAWGGLYLRASQLPEILSGLQNARTRDTQAYCAASATAAQTCSENRPRPVATT